MLKSILTDEGNYGKLLFVAECKIFATVAQPVEQLTRNEQVVRSNRISSSRNKTPESWLVKPIFRGFLLGMNFFLEAAGCAKVHKFREKTENQWRKRVKKALKRVKWIF